MSASADRFEGRARWLALQDELLRGLTHALSNRLATLSAAAYMLEYGDITAAEAATSLRTETERLDAILRLLRQLPARDEGVLEPVAPGDIVEAAVALHAHHGDLRDVPVTVAVADDVLPVLVEPHALRQALLLALTAAKRAAHHAGSGVTDGVRIDVTGDAEWVVLRVFADGTIDPDAEATRRDALAARACLAHAIGDAEARADGGCELRLATLLAARRAGR